MRHAQCPVQTWKYLFQLSVVVVHPTTASQPANSVNINYISTTLISLSVMYSSSSCRCCCCLLFPALFYPSVRVPVAEAAAAAAGENKPCTLFAQCVYGSNREREIGNLLKICISG